MKRVVWLLVAMVVVVLTAFDVSVNVRFALPTDSIVPDPEIEALFDACFRARDDDIHHTAFSTIDNPDVQKEYISAHRAMARAACRAQYPETSTTVTTPLQFNIVDWQARYW